MKKTPQPAILVLPETPRVDEKIEIVVTGLEPKQCVTLRLTETGLPDGVLEGTSYALFKADERGEVRPSKQKPLAGTYEDIDPTLRRYRSGCLSFFRKNNLQIR